MSSKKLLSFSEGNSDVYQLLEGMDKYSQFVCEAIRFYKNYLDNLKEDKVCVLEKSSNLDNDIKHLEQVLSKKIDRVEKLIGKITTTSSIGVKPIDEDIRKQILNEDD